jgi:hypothetical protein
VFRIEKKHRTVSRLIPRRSGRKAFCPRLEFLEPRLAPANVDVLTWHNDNTLSGANNQEEVLTPANVNSTNFGMLFTYRVDGYVYAQPLYKANLTLPDGSTHDVVFVATEHDSVYAFDADNPSAGPNNNGLLWQRSFLDPANGITTVPNGDVGSGDIVPEIGITGTPVINAATNTLYVVAATKELRGSVYHYVQKLYALNITTGQDVAAPFTIGDTTGTNTNTSVISVAGTGDGSVGGVVKFNALRESERSGLALSADGSVVYVDWASHGDVSFYHGWVVAFDANSLQPISWFNTTPNSGLGGIWQSGGSVAVDPETGNLYFATGNSKAANPPPGDLGESVVELNAANGQLTLADYFTASNKVTLDQKDQDLGSGGTMILPDQPGPFPHLIVETGKQGTIYLLNRDDLGGYKQGTNAGDRVVQELAQGVTGVWGSPAFFLTDPSTESGLVYYHGQDDVLRSFRLLNGRLTAVSPVGKNRFNFPGAQPSISSNGTQDGIVWEIQTDAYSSQGPAILHAYNALNLSDELYRSDQEVAGTAASAWLRDQLGPATKFTVPTITNGRVFVGTGNSISVFGLFPAPTGVPGAASNLVAQTIAPTGRHVTLTWTNNATDATGVRIYRSTDDVNFTLLNTMPSSATTYTDTTTLAGGTVYYYQVVATNQLGNGQPSNTAVVSTPGAPILSLANVISTEIDLSWTQTGNAHYDVQRSTDGVNFVAINQAPILTTVTSYSDLGLEPGTYSYRVLSINVNPDESFFSNVVSAQLPTDLIDHSGGFSQNSDLTANGTAVFAGGFARLTQGAIDESGSVFSNTELSITNFTTTFTFRVHEGSDPRGEGLTFILQANSPTALGQGGGGLGYAGIGNSVAIKFDMFKPSGDHSSTGLYVDGDYPDIAPNIGPNDVYVDLDGTGIDFNTQDTMQVNLAYDGTTLTQTITDLYTGTTFTTSYTVNIPAFVGSNMAYIGFGGGTSDPNQGGGTCLQDIETWVYGAPTTAPAGPSNLTANVAGAQVMLAWQCNSTNEDGFSIEQSTDGVNFVAIATTGRGVTTYTDTPAQPGTYYYRVNAFNLAGVSGYTNIIQVDVPGAPPPGGGAGGHGKGPGAFAIGVRVQTSEMPGLQTGPGSDLSLGNAVPASSSTRLVPTQLNTVAELPVSGSTTRAPGDLTRMRSGDREPDVSLVVHDLLGAWLTEDSALAPVSAVDRLFAGDRMEVS